MRTVLFVCSANLDRSPTAERLFHGWKSRWEAKSCGIMPALGRNRITQSLIEWADLVLVMEPAHAEYVYRHLKCDPSKIRVLGIGNNYVRDDPELVRELEEKVIPILERSGKRSTARGKEWALTVGVDYVDYSPRHLVP